MNIVTKYECEICGQQFDDEADAFKHELEHSFPPEVKEAIHLYNSEGSPLSFSIDSADDAYFIKCDTVEALDAFKDLYINYLGYTEFPKAKTEEEKTSEWYYQDDDWKSFKSLSDEYNRIKSIFEQSRGD